MSAIVAVHGLHELTLPVWLTYVWVATNFLLSILVLAGMWVFLATPGISRSRKVFMAGFAVFVFRGVVTALERWDQAINVEGAPVNTVALLLAAIGIRLWIAEHHRSSDR